MNWRIKKYGKQKYINIFRLIKILYLLNKKFMIPSISLLMKIPESEVFYLLNKFKEKQIIKIVDIDELIKKSFIGSDYINENFYRKYGKE